MANPPAPIDPPSSSVVTHGTILSYGLDDITVTGVLIDSYKRDAKFANVDEITNQVGVVTGLRMSDYRVDISVSGRVLQASAPTCRIGSTFSCNGDVGVITDVGVSGEAQGFAKIDIKAVAYSGVSGLTAS